MKCTKKAIIFTDSANEQDCLTALRALIMQIRHGYNSGKIPVQMLMDVINAINNCRIDGVHAANIEVKSSDFDLAEVDTADLP